MPHNEYLRWAAMMGRCYDSDHKSYHGYGARGIKVCKSWHDYRNFFKDVGPVPKGLSLDRINNDGDYEPGNVRLADPRTQANNRRSTKRYTYKGQTKTIRDWADHTGLTYATLAARILKGWTIEDAIEKPCRPKTGAKELADASGVAPNTIHYRQKRGLTGDDLLRDNMQVRKFDYQGRTQTLTQWSEELNISRKALERRIYRGMPVDEAFSKPQMYSRK